MRFRDCIAAALLTLWAASAALAQGQTDESSRIRHGERKIRIGLSLLAAGALTIPVTYVTSERLSSGPAAAGAGLMITGGLVIASAFGINKKPSDPQPLPF